MELDSTASPSIASDKQCASPERGEELAAASQEGTPNGGQAAAGPEVETCPGGNSEAGAQEGQRDDDWSYVFTHHTRVKTLTGAISRMQERQQLLPPGARGGDEERAFVPDFFIHYSTRYVYDSNERRKKQTVPTISGLVFLQGRASRLRRFLSDNFEGLHLVNDCATGRPAVISSARMEPLRSVMQRDPARIRILDKPMATYAQGRPVVRVLTGDFKGWEGVVVRISRDRKLVLRLDNNLTIAVGRIHQEDYALLTAE